MTREEKAKKYDEALEWMREVYPTLTGAAKEDAEHYFPELKESEDEKIRKRIRLCLDECVHSDIIRDYERDECLAYLEKQKEKPENATKTLAKILKDSAEGFRRILKKKGIDYEVSDKFWENEAVVYSKEEKIKFQKWMDDSIGPTPIEETYEYKKGLEAGMKQKEQIPYIDFVIKPHKGDDTNPYDMGASEAQDYIIKRGFSIPFTDGEVYVDERHIIQTIGNILKWADEHPKEQKPSINIDQLKSMMLQYLQEAANEKEDSDIEVDTDKWARKILGYDFEQKPTDEQFPPLEGLDAIKAKYYDNGFKNGFDEGVESVKPAEFDEYKIIKKHITKDILSSEVNKRLTECGWYVTDEKPKEWSEEDKKMLNLTIEWAEIMSDQFSFADVDPKDFRKIIAWLKSLKDRGNFPKSNTNSPSEWSEEDKETIDLTIAVLKENLPNDYFKTNPANTLNMGAIHTDQLINRLKSLHLQSKQEQKYYWKPTETDVALFNKAVTTNETLTPEERAQLDIIRSKFGYCRATNCNGIVQPEQKPEVKLKGWIARDKEYNSYFGLGLVLFNGKPIRSCNCWSGTIAAQLPWEIFPDIKWEDEPVEVEIIIRKK